MGLDGVSILIESENTFNITITDAEASSLRTPHELTKLVVMKVGAVRSEVCATQPVFYQLRSGFRAAIPALVDDFGPDTRIGTLVHRDQWPRVWEAVKTAAGAAEWPAVGWSRFGFRPRSVRELVWHIVIETAPPSPQHKTRWTTQEVAVAVRRIIAEESGVNVGFDQHQTFSRLGID